MKTCMMVALFAGLSLSGLAVEKRFQIDPVHSGVQFRIRHLYSTFAGRFNKFEGTLTVDPDKPTTLKVSASVDVTSVDTANGDRDKHLRSLDFFDTDHYTNATFESTQTVVGDVKNAGTVTGKLTIRGITKDVTFQGQLTGYGVDSHGTNRVGFHATTTIRRTDFGVSYNATIPPGVTVLGDDVELILDLEAIEEKTATTAETKTPSKSVAPSKAPAQKTSKTPDAPRKKQ